MLSNVELGTDKTEDIRGILECLNDVMIPEELFIEKELIPSAICYVYKNGGRFTSIDDVALTVGEYFYSLYLSQYHEKILKKYASEIAIACAVVVNYTKEIIKDRVKNPPNLTTYPEMRYNTIN